VNDITGLPVRYGELARRNRATLAALAGAVAAIEDLGGCVDVQCRLPECWLGRLDGEARQQAERAVRFVTEQEALR
jgi:hypothetical protein